MPDAARKWKTVLIYGSVTVLFLAIVEFSARLDDWVRYRAPLWGRYDSQLLRTYDPDGIRINIPNGRFEKWRNNNFGFRGPDITLKKQDGVRRVICLGTSETYGLYETENREWPAQLRDYLADKGRYEVINGATVGLPFADYPAYVDKYILPFEPDLVVLLIEPTSHAARVARLANNPAAAAAPPANPVGRGLSPASIKENIRTLPKLQQAIKGFLPASWMQAYRARDARRNIVAAESFYLKGKAPLDMVPERFLEIYREDLTRVIDQLRERGIGVILCTYPSLLSRDSISKYETVYLEGRRFVVELSVEGMIAAMEQYNRLSRLVAGEMGLPLVDLAATIPRTDDCFADHVHYTDRGAELVARQVGDLIAGY